MSWLTAVLPKVVLLVALLPLALHPRQLLIQVAFYFR